MNRIDLQESGDFTWRVSDCEELVGLLTGDDVNELVYVVFLSCSQYHRQQLKGFSERTHPYKEQRPCQIPRPLLILRK